MIFLQKQLSYLAAWFDVFGGGDYAEALVKINSRENHALTFDAHHLTGGKVGYEQDALTNEFLRVLIEGSDT